MQPLIFKTLNFQAKTARRLNGLGTHSHSSASDFIVKATAIEIGSAWPHRDERLCGST
jgi:uncharacterized protein (DUF736 family)